MLPVPMDRLSGRRSSSIGCRSIVGRRTSVYITSVNTQNCDPFKLIVEINSQVALFRDLLIHIGQSKDGPELREKVRKLRRSCVEACKHTSQLILPQVTKSIVNLTADDNGVQKSPNIAHRNPAINMGINAGPDDAKSSDGDNVMAVPLQSIPSAASNASTSVKKNSNNAINTSDINPQPSLEHLASSTSDIDAVNGSNNPDNSNPNLLLLFCLAQLFLRELFKSHRLIQVVPMDMSGYYENRAGPSNLGNVISQILLCKQITPDFNQEELCSIVKDSQEIAKILSDMQEYLPLHDPHMEKTIALTGDDQNGPWPAKRRRNSIYKNMGLLCCVSRPNYM